MVNATVGFMKAFDLEISKGYGIGIGVSSLGSAMIVLVFEKIGVHYFYCFLYVFIGNFFIVYYLKKA